MADCNGCTGYCCKYITIQLDEPEDTIDFEELKWFLCHENIFVYIDHDNDWCVEVATPCKYQDPITNLCTAYETRPVVCEEHDSDDCEANVDYDPYYKRAFRKPEDIEVYMDELIKKGKFKYKDKKRKSRIRFSGSPARKMSPLILPKIKM